MNNQVKHAYLLLLGIFLLNFCSFAEPFLIKEALPVWAEGRQTFRQNTVDIFMDCSSRERANAFIGNYLRLDILSGYGLQNQLLSEIQDYFYNMTRLTGTLWENMGAQASCNHGFASYLGHVLYRDVLGISKIDYIEKEVTIRFTDIDLNECSGAIPVENDAVELKWKRAGNLISYSVKAPGGYKLKVQNLSSSRLLKIR